LLIHLFNRRYSTAKVISEKFYVSV